MKKILFIILLFVFIISGFYFKDDIYRLFSNNSFKKQVIFSNPLRIGGESSGAVLTKEGIIRETNIQREKYGLTSLKENEKLNSAAMAKANDMFDRQYFSHIDPDGNGPDKVVEGAGYYYIITGENLLLGNFKGDKDAVQAWMDSPPHKENILENRYTEMGAATVKGIFEGEEVWIGVQEFGLPLSFCPEIDSSLKEKINLSQMELDVLSGKIEEKKREADNFKNKNSSQYLELIKEYNDMVNSYNHKAKQLEKYILDYNNQIDEFNKCASLK